ncbi:MAG TPA: hypothetical protein VFU05_07245 [Cyclobacteriaceae bacterium]|nr:hypothetical protein [Cyclobacteriaceae bacterium]
MTLAARIVTFVFHPILIPALTCLSIFGSGDFGYFFLSKRDLYNVTILTLIIPLLVVSVFKLMGLISSIYVESVRERIIVLSSILIIQFVAVIANGNALTGLTRMIIFNLAVITFLIILITNFIRVSIHSVSVWASVKLFFILNTDGSLIVLLCVSIFIAGLVMSSRLYLNEHKPAEVYLGAAIGLICFINI